MAELAIRGGAPVRPHGYPEWPVHDERDVEAVAAAVRSGRWGGFPEPGPLAAEFAARFAAYQGAAHGVVMSNGTVTMEVALKALGIGWGDEVIVPALTFAATPYAAMAAGALPVFCDVVPGTLTIDPDQVEAAVTPRTRAVMPVHLGHQMADMDRVMETARRHSLAVVEDCAHAPGQRWRGHGAGTFGEFGSFSHQSSKILTAGEGGSLLTGDEQLARRAHSLIDCGRPKDAGGKELTFGANYRLGELHAALLLVALERFAAQRAERAGNGLLFQDLARGVPGVRPLEPLLLRPADRAGGLRRRLGRAGLRGARGRGRGLLARLPADEPLRPVPAVAVAPAGRPGLLSAARPGPHVVPGRRAARPAPDGLPRRKRLPRRTARDRGRGRSPRQGPAPRRRADRGAGPATRLKVAQGSRDRPGVSAGEEPGQVGAAALEQRVQQGDGDLVLADQGVGEQGLEREAAVAGDGCPDRQALVGLHLLDQAEQLGREGREGQGVGAGGVDARRDLDHGVGRQVREGPVVADVDDLHVAGAGVERGDELGGGLAVEGAAAPVQQRRLGVERRVAVQAQQLLLDRRDLLRPGRAAPLLREHLAGQVEVAQVVGGNGAEQADQPDGQVDLVRERLGVPLQQLRQAVDAVDPDRPLPREVVQADVLQLDPLRVHLEVGGEPALEADGHVAQADRAVALVEQGLGDDPDRVGEVHQPGARGAAARGLLGQLQHDRDRPERLGEAARPGGLLADAPELERQRLVDQPLRLAADPELRDHEVGAVQRLLPPPGERQAPPEAGPRQHAAGEPAHHRQTLGLRVEEDELVHGQPCLAGGEALHQLRGVGAATPDHRDLEAHAQRLPYRSLRRLLLFTTMTKLGKFPYALRAAAGP